MKYALRGREWCINRLPKGVRYDEVGGFNIRSYLIESDELRAKLSAPNLKGEDVYNALASYTDNQGQPYVYLRWETILVTPDKQGAKQMATILRLRKGEWRVDPIEDSERVGEVFSPQRDYGFLEVSNATRT